MEDIETNFKMIAFVMFLFLALSLARGARINITNLLTDEEFEDVKAANYTPLCNRPTYK